ncbi:MAG TPA: alpha/beta hydrolase, partial [Solirubrobacterales bacterium]|nr:alpha/beta hydrolase [Solirubrobacterales bacterium]
IWRAGESLRRRGNGKGVYVQAIVRALRPLEQPGAREAFLQTLRAVIDRRGQRVNANDRLYLLGGIPTLIVWGERDRTIPIEHGLEAERAVPNCRFETLPRAAHFPNLEDPDGLAAVLADFMATTAPAHIVDSEWRDVIAQRARLRRVA